MTYLRWDEGDADLIAPSIYGGRDVPKRKARGEEPAAAAQGERASLEPCECSNLHPCIAK